MDNKKQDSKKGNPGRESGRESSEKGNQGGTPNRQLQMQCVVSEPAILQIERKQAARHSAACFRFFYDFAVWIAQDPNPRKHCPQ